MFRPQLEWFKKQQAEGEKGDGSLDLRGRAPVSRMAYAQLVAIERPASADEFDDGEDDSDAGGGNWAVLDWGRLVYFTFSRRRPVLRVSESAALCLQDGI